MASSQEGRRLSSGAKCLFKGRGRATLTVLGYRNWKGFLKCNERELTSEEIADVEKAADYENFSVEGVVRQQLTRTPRGLCYTRTLRREDRLRRRKEESRYAQRSGALIFGRLTGNKLLPRPNLSPTLTLALPLLWGKSD